MRPQESMVADLSELRGNDLAPVLEAQAAHWRTHFAWDCAPAMAAVRRMLDRRLLCGRALLVSGVARGYSYFVAEGRKAVIGDLFVQDPDKNGRLERRLLESTLNAACLQQGVERVEGQLLCLDRLPALRPALGGIVRGFPRALMLKRGLGRPLAGRPANSSLHFCPWSEGLLGDASELIALAYRGHVDSRINDLYGSASGARRLLVQTTRYAVSARFFAPAAIVARAPEATALHGLCLGSLVGNAVGHVTQLCVAPHARGRGLGSELLRRSLDAFARAGCKAASLTVTESNAVAVRLYKRNGFRSIASFPAFAWQRR